MLLLGIWLGGVLFHSSQPRSFLSLIDCRDRCYRMNELAGLLTSAGIQQMPFVLPEVVAETDECIAIRHPFDRQRKHYVLFSKKDIRDIAEIEQRDSPYVMSCFAIVRQLVLSDHLDAYRVWSNGPGEQNITYLHFHLAETRGR